MDKGDVIRKFDRMVRDKVAFFDYEQKVINYSEGSLTCSFVLTSALLKKPTLDNSSIQNNPQPCDKDKQLRPGSDISTVDFEIGTIGGSHVVVVNKFSFARPQLMLVSSDGYRRQYELN